MVKRRPSKGSKLKSKERLEKFKNFVKEKREMFTPRITKEHSEENEEKEQSRFDLAESTLQLTNDLSDFKERKKRLEGSAASLEEMEYHLKQKYLEDLEKILDEIGEL
ncbi:9472_t:CDS:1 [Funneliformis caledonium]|uniref:9472_t:CDS:1 n=1 Tax=Funneliformis caledonium TaxID=1117310 RepID=A0A9N9INT8_9GLOM|nr:9472_t:CDS:1 [Funneliformis caledonium]